MSQVNFFMLPEDEADFAAVLTSRVDTRIFPARALDLAAHAGAYRLVLLNPSLGWPPEIDALEAEPPTPPTTAFDLFKDAQIEWARSYSDENTLLAGRLYAKIGWLDSPAANVTYRRWYDALARWIRQRYVRHDGWWVSPRAHLWWQEGNLLSFGGGRAHGQSFRE